MSMISQIAKLLGIREDQVDGALKSDPDARRFISRRGLLLGAVGAAAGVVVPSAPLVQVATQLEPLVKRYKIEASWSQAASFGMAVAAYHHYRHADGSSITVAEVP